MAYKVAGDDQRPRFPILDVLMSFCIAALAGLMWGIAALTDLRSEQFHRSIPQLHHPKLPRITITIILTADLMPEGLTTITILDRFLEPGWSEHRQLRAHTHAIDWRNMGTI